MKNFYKKYKIQLVLSGYLVFLGIFGYGGVFLIVKNIQTQADEIQRKIIDAELDKKNLAKIPQLIEDYEIFHLQENKLDAILQKESEVEFIKSLENLAKETGNEINLKLIEGENPAANNNSEKAAAKEKKSEDIKNRLPYEKYITIQLELGGDYPGLLKFLKKLENMEYFANIVALDLKKEEKEMENRPSNPFVGDNRPREEQIIEKQEGEILKSLITLIVYVQ